MKSLIYWLFSTLTIVACVNRNTDQPAGQKLVTPDTTPQVNSTDISASTSGSNEIELPFRIESDNPGANQSGANPERGTAEFHFKRGLVLYAINNYDEGILEFDTTITIDPKLTTAYINRGKGYLHVQNYPKALADFQQAVDLDNKDTTAYLHLALAHYHLGNLQQCVEANNEYVRLAPNSATAYFNRGTAFGKLNDLPKAIRDFSSAVSISPKYAEAHFNLGLSYYYSGDTTQACQSWKTAAGLGFEKAKLVVENYCK